MRAFLIATLGEPAHLPHAETYTTLSMVEELPLQTTMPTRPMRSALPVDEVDQALAPYIASATGSAELTAPEAVVSAEPIGERRVVEVTVKRGDALEKIARANGTTVTEFVASTAWQTID